MDTSLIIVIVLILVVIAGAVFFWNKDTYVKSRFDTNNPIRGTPYGGIVPYRQQPLQTNFPVGPPVDYPNPTMMAYP